MRGANDRRPGPAFWRSFAIFEGLGDAAVADLADAAVVRSWPAGAPLFARGDPGEWLVALAAGRVKLSVTSADGRELALAHAEAGDVLGEMAALDGAPRSADATAVEAATGHVVARADLAAILARHPSAAEAVIRFLCRRLRDTNDRLESLALHGLEARVARFFLVALRALHGDEPPPEPRLRLDLSQSDLAALLGASRPKVNRALQELAERGAIRRDGDAFACDPALLAALAG